MDLKVLFNLSKVTPNLLRSNDPIPPTKMEQEISNFLIKKFNDECDYIKIKDNQTLEIVYNLLIRNNELDEEKSKMSDEIIYPNPLLCYYYGIYHHYNLNKRLLKLYYKKAFEHGLIEAANALGYYYHIQCKFEKMEYYYLLAIEQGNAKSMYHLANYYHDIREYSSSEKYFLIAIERGHVKSMYSLGVYYHSMGNYEKIRFYYQMAIERGDINSMIMLGSHYESHKKYQQMEIYYLMAINRGYDCYLSSLSDYYYHENRIDEMIQYNLMMIEKYNNRMAWNALTNKYQDNLVELLDLINLHRDLNKRKEKYRQLIIKDIPINVRHFRFKDGSIGMKILNYRFMMNQGNFLRVLEPEEKIYQEINEKEPTILDYLNIINVTEIKKKIEEYYTIYCC